MSETTFLRVNWTGRESERAFQGYLEEGRGAAWIPRSAITSAGERWVEVTLAWARAANVISLRNLTAEQAASRTLHNGVSMKSTAEGVERVDRVDGPLPPPVKPLLRKAGETERKTTDVLLKRKRDAPW